jgi:hypothetical protein
LSYIKNAFIHLSKKRELIDLASISDQEIRNDDIVYMVFQKEVGGGWEEIQADTLVSFGDDQTQLSGIAA